MKRVVSYELIDERYLKEMFVPSYRPQSCQSLLSNSVIQLDANLKEFRDFMRQVEAGKIPVTQGLKGDWQSFIRKDGAWLSATYSGREGLVFDFQKHADQNPYSLISGLHFSTSGFISWAAMGEDGFGFDEHGKVQSYWNARYKSQIHWHEREMK
jgi:hypothetical protein